MFRVSLLCVLLLSVVCLFCVSDATVIVSDDYGSEVGLPVMGGQATGGFSINGAQFPLSPYNVTVYITNELVSYEGSYGPQDQSFFVAPSFNQASLINSFFAAGTLNPESNKVIYEGPVLTGNYLGSASAPNTAVGAYTYQFDIPAMQALNAKIIYSNLGNPTVTDYITVQVVNSHPDA